MSTFFSTPGFLYFAASLSFLVGVSFLFEAFGRESLPVFGVSRKKRELQRIFEQLQEHEEMLGAGMVPPASRWEKLRSLERPWGDLAHDSLTELRSSGGAILPTLRRFKALISDHQKALVDASARSAQALAQAGGCALLIPTFGAILYVLLPGVEDRPWTWIALCGVALILSGLGALWMFSMVEAARWAGLPKECRNWVLAAQCSAERFLALIRSGVPADLAWTRACELLSREAPALALSWGHSIWISAAAPASPYSTQATCRILIDTGKDIRKAVQLSMMEGRPCAERVEAVLVGLSQEIHGRTERELSLLGTRALKPLFLCVAPGIFLLLAAGLYLSFLQLS